MSAAAIPVQPAEEWDRHLTKAIADHIRPVSPIARANVAGAFTATASFSSSSGQNPYTVQVVSVAGVVSVLCSCPGGAKPMRCKHAAAMLATLGLI